MKELINNITTSLILNKGALCQLLFQIETQGLIPFQAALFKLKSVKTKPEQPWIRPGFDCNTIRHNAAQNNTAYCVASRRCQEETVCGLISRATSRITAARPSHHTGAGSSVQDGSGGPSRSQDQAH